MKELSVNKLENLEGGRFWGTANCRWVGNSCFQVQYCDHYVFWINTGSSLSGRSRVGNCGFNNN